MTSKAYEAADVLLEEVTTCLLMNTAESMAEAADALRKSMLKSGTVDLDLAYDLIDTVDAYLAEGPDGQMEAAVEGLRRHIPALTTEQREARAASKLRSATENLLDVVDKHLGYSANPDMQEAADALRASMADGAPVEAEMLHALFDEVEGHHNDGEGGWSLSHHLERVRELAPIRVSAPSL